MHLLAGQDAALGDKSRNRRDDRLPGLVQVGLLERAGGLLYFRVILLTPIEN